MNLKGHAILVLILLTLPLTASGQAQPPVIAPPGLSSRQMQEDVAVFRVLLNRSLARHYGFPTSTDQMAHLMAHTAPHAEGIALKGHGVLYSASVAMPLSDPLGKSTGAEKAVSDWERALMELRGEKAAEEIKKGETRKTSLSETLLHLLAENGKHFKQMTGEERLTIALTFRANLDCAKCHMAANSGNLGGVPGRYSEPRTSALPLPGMYDASRAKSSMHQGAPMVPPPTTDDRSNDQLLGDLQFKQGRYREAEQAYMRALKRQQENSAGLKSAEKMKRLLISAEIAARLAQCGVALGEDDKAKSALDLARRLNEAAVKLTDEFKGGKSTADVPVQLIVSATKQQLDQVGAGKLSFEEFRKAASVELRKYDPEK